MRNISCMLGVHFAVTADQERRLLAADDEGDADTVAELLEDIEKNWDDEPPRGASSAPAVEVAGTLAGYSGVATMHSAAW